MTSLQAVLFDLDDTLIDWSAIDGNWAEIRRRHLEPVVQKLAEHGHSPLDIARVAEVYDACNREAWQAAEPPDWVAPQQLKVLRQTLDRLDISISDDDLDELQQLFAWGSLPGVGPFPDTIDVLETIRAAGVQTGLVTNASSPMWMRDRELEAYGLLDYLDVRVTAGDAGHLKPHPYAFEWVLERLGIEPEYAVFVGDYMEADVVGAQNIGMKGVWIDRKRGHENNDAITPDAIIEQLSELLGVLDEWYPGWRNT